MNNFAVINPNIIEHEGFYYLEFEGEFYKGCRRCGGSGHYSHNGEHSRCYECDDTSAKLGEHLASREAAEKWCHERAVRRAQRLRKAEAKAKAAQDARDARIAATDPEVVEALRKVYDAEQEAYATGDYRLIQRTSGFLRTMAGKLFNASENGLTDNMVAAVKRTIEQDKARAAESAANPVVEGRQVITGEVIFAKEVENDYGFSVKMLIKTDKGFKVYGTVPSAMLETSTVEEIKGRRVTLTATVSASQDDPGFGFYSRPTKGTWI